MLEDSRLNCFRARLVGYHFAMCLFYQKYLHSLEHLVSPNRHRLSMEPMPRNQMCIPGFAYTK